MLGYSSVFEPRVDHLDELGISAGDVVAVKLRNRVEFVVLLFACWRLSATVTPVNPSLTDAEVTLQLQASGARLLVVEDAASGPGEVATLAVGNLYAKGPGWDGPPLVDPSALALLIYTSGTTGMPKGVMLDHANLDAMAEMGRKALGIGPADRCLLILPLFHVNGIVVSVVIPLLAGASVVIAERFDPHTFFDIGRACVDPPTSARCPPSTPCWPRCLTTSALTPHRCDLGSAGPHRPRRSCWPASRLATASRSSRDTGCLREPAPPPSTPSTVTPAPARWETRFPVSGSGSSTPPAPTWRPGWTVRSHRRPKRHARLSRAARRHRPHRRRRLAAHRRCRPPRRRRLSDPESAGRKT